VLPSIWDRNLLSERSCIAEVETLRGLVGSALIHPGKMTPNS
jgi:hypothetical protein